MKTHAERHADAADEQRQIDATEEGEKEEARRRIQEAAAVRREATVELEARLAREDDDAKARVFAAGDARLFPLAKAMHDEATNRGTVETVETVEALDVAALAATGEVYPLRRVALLLAEIHRQKRPAILEHLAGARAWYSVQGGGLGGVEFAHDLRNAIGRHDIAGVRSAFEKFDARLWSLTQKPIDEQALVAWQATLQPDPRVLRNYEAEAAKRQAEAEYAAADKAGLAAVRHGGAKLLGSL